MQFDHPRIMACVIAALAVLLVYRRLRRSFGRQPFSPWRMRIRVGILSLLGCSLLPAAMRAPQFLAADLAGLLAGIALGVWGARLTRYERRDGRLYYIPHTYSGIAVSLLLVGRLVYRMMFVYSANRAAGYRAAGYRAAGYGAVGDPVDAMQVLNSSTMFKSPLTVGLLCVVIGYYVCYYCRVLWKSNRIGPEDLEVSATPIAVSQNEYGGSSPGR